jgi:hypothetical protein
MFLKNSYILQTFVVTVASNEDFKNESAMLLPATQGRQFYEVSFSQSNLEQRLKSTVKGKSIFFRISCINIVGVSVPSSTVNSKLISTPSSPLGLGISFQGGGVLLRWLLPADTGIGNNLYPLANYFVEVDKNNFTSCPSSVSSCLSVKLVSGTCSCWQVDASFLRFRPVNLSKGVLYWFRVFAKNDAGFGPASSTSSARALELPQAPVLVQSQQTTRAISLSWIPPLDFGLGSGIFNSTGAGMYMLEYTIMPGFEVFKSILVSGKSATISEVSAGSIYYARVAALNYAGIGWYSPTLQIQLVIDIAPQVLFSFSLSQFFAGVGGSEYAVMVQNTQKFISNDDECDITIQGVVVKASVRFQISEGCGRSQFFRTVFNFTVPAIYLNFSSQYSTVAASVTISKRGISLSCGDFPYVLPSLARPTIKYMLPSVGPVAGGTRVVVGVDGYPRPLAPEDLEVFVSLSPTRSIPVNFQVIDDAGVILLSTPNSSAGTYSIFLQNRPSKKLMVF